MDTYLCASNPYSGKLNCDNTFNLTVEPLPIQDFDIHLMSDTDISSCTGLISKAMNPDEGQMALNTFLFHFSCKEYNIDDGRTYFVLTKNAHIIGIVGLHHYHWGPPENVWLAWFAVDPDHHGQGIGKYLLNFITNKARTLGYKKFFIETYSGPEFTRARSFYQSQGFIKVGSVQSYLSNGDNMIIFLKNLILPV